MEIVENPQNEPEPVKTITKWKCPRCKKINNMEHYKCECGIDLEAFEDLSQILIEVPIEEKKETE